MSLYFKERIDEQKKEEGPLKNKIIFTYPWIITVPPPANGDDHLKFHEKFGTTYLNHNETWFMRLIRDGIRIGDDYGINFDEDDDDDVSRKEWYGSCYLSYNLYNDNDMRYLLYSSARIRMNDTNKDAFKTHDGFMTRMVEAYDERKIAKIVIMVEIHLPPKNFYQPYDDKDSCEPYPSNIENNFRYEFLERSDYVIKCRDGEIPGRRSYLNVASEFFKKHFKTSQKLEFVVDDHLIDVVKPVVIYLHTRYFEMPKFYYLGFAMRLLAAVDFFELKHAWHIRHDIQKSLCNKFVNEYHDFDSILQWARIVSRHSLSYLLKMVATVIADKFYFKWNETFPEVARNVENPLFLDICGPENSTVYEYEYAKIFEEIDKIFHDSFLVNVILP